MIFVGDGRNDFFGYIVRYCVYIFMEEFFRLIVDLEVVDKREIGGKLVVMEKLVFLRFLRRLKDVIIISYLVIDVFIFIKVLVRDMKGIFVGLIL